MFHFDTIDFHRIAVSSAGALLLSAACVVGAVGPARAAEPNAPLTISDWQQDVNEQIDNNLRVPANFDSKLAATTVSVVLNANGEFGGASVAKSSGHSAVDREAIRVARTIDYPTLPSGLRGKPQTVTMQVYIGTSADGIDRRAERLAATRKADRIQTAALPIG